MNKAAVATVLAFKTMQLFITRGVLVDLICFTLPYIFELNAFLH